MKIDLILQKSNRQHNIAILAILHLLLWDWSWGTMNDDDDVDDYYLLHDFLLVLVCVVQ